MKLTVEIGALTLIYSDRWRDDSIVVILDHPGVEPFQMTISELIRMLQGVKPPATSIRELAPMVDYGDNP